jgi:hypothetical protein
MTTTPEDDRYGKLGQHGVALFLRAAEAAPVGTLQHAIAAQIRAELPEFERIDVRGDCTCAPGESCVCTIPHGNARTDADRMHRGTRSPTEHPVVIELDNLVARAAAAPTHRLQEADAAAVPEIRRALRAFEKLTQSDEEDDPTTERTDMTTIDESTARYRMNRDAAVAWTRPLGGHEHDPAPEPTLEQKERMDAAERDYTSRERDRCEFEAHRPRVHTTRLDADEAVESVEPGTPVEELELLIAISKRESIPLQELIDSLERLRSLRGKGDDAMHSDALDEETAKARMNARCHRRASLPMDRFGDVVEDSQ